MKNLKLNFDIDIGHKEVEKYLEQKGFTLIERYQGKSEGSLAIRCSYLRLMHKNINKKILNIFNPELIFYYDPSNSTGLFFHFAISVVTNSSRSSFIPFSGDKFHKIVRRNKNLSRVSESLKYLFDNFDNLIDFLSYLTKNEPSHKQGKKFLKRLIECRFHKYFIAHNKEILIDEIDPENFLPKVKGLKSPESFMGLYIRFLLSNLDEEYFNPQTFYYIDQKTGKTRISETRRPLDNTYRRKQLCELCFNVLEETYNELNKVNQKDVFSF